MVQVVLLGKLAAHHHSERSPRTAAAEVVLQMPQGLPVAVRAWDLAAALVTDRRQGPRPVESPQECKDSLEELRPIQPTTARVAGLVGAGRPRPERAHSEALQGKPAGAEQPPVLQAQV